MSLAFKNFKKPAVHKAGNQRILVRQSSARCLIFILRIWANHRCIRWLGRPDLRAIFSGRRVQEDQQVSHVTFL